MIETGVCEAIRHDLTAMDAQGFVRIKLTSTGCCDASLGMRVGTAGESDLVQEAGGITFIMHKDVHDRVGMVTISRRDNANYVLTPGRPLSEWDGFGSCKIKV
jgi:hypothetical protein